MFIPPSRYLSLFCFSFFLMIKAVFAAGGPDLYGYTWKDSNDPGGPVYNWIDIKSFQEVVDVKLLSDDNFRGPYPLGFTFPYYWYGFDHFSIGSNGNLSIDHQQYAHPYSPFPSINYPQNIVAAFGCDLTYEQDSTAKCYLYISPDLDSVVVTWEDVPFFDSIPPNYATSFRNTFQIILCASDSSINFQYKEVHSFNLISNYFFSAGIESNAGNIGLSYRYNVFPSSQTAVKFYRPQNNNFQIIDLAAEWSGSPGTKGITLNNNSYVNNFQASVINLGNTPIDSALITGSLLDPSGNIIFSTQQNSGLIMPGQSQSIQFPNGYQFTQIGRYTFRTSFSYPGDNLSHNNQKKQEVIVMDTLLGPVTLGWSDYWADDYFYWAGSIGGLGIFITPPFYPFQITSLMYYIHSRDPGSSFYAKVFSESFISGQPGVPLYSSLVSSNTFSNNDWCEITLNPPIHLNSGSVYVALEGTGSSVKFGVDYSAPYSNQAYEFLGMIWSPFRYNDIEPMIAVKAIPAHTFNGLLEENKDKKLQIFPNPSSGYFTLFAPDITEFQDEIVIEIYNSQGQKIHSEWKRNTDGKIILDLRSAEGGIYWLNLNHGDENIHGKLIKQD